MTTSMTDCMVIGERFNMPQKEQWDVLANDDPETWLEISVRCGAFRNSLSRNKLARLGITLGRPKWQGAEQRGARSLNLLPPAPQGVKWDEGTAEFVACAMWEDLREYATVFLCGRRVATAFGVPREWPILSRMWQGEQPFEWRLLAEDEACEREVVVLPHPSGLSRWWNDAANVELGRELVARYVTS